MASITELVKNIRNAILGKDVRESIAGAIEQCYEDASKNGNANMEVTEARGTFSTLNNRLDNSDIVKANKSDVETIKKNLQGQVNSLASGSPLVANSMEEMIDTSRVYVNTSNGHWYTYNGSNWVDGGVYQAIEIADGSVNKDKLNFTKKGRNIFDENNYNYLNAFFLKSNGVLRELNEGGTIFFNCKPNTTYTIYKPIETNRFSIGTCKDSPIPGTLETGTNIDNIIELAGDSKNLVYMTDENANYFLIYLKNSNDVSLDKMVKGLIIVENSYMDYEEEYQNLNLSRDDIQNDLISPEKTTFYKKTRNVLNYKECKILTFEFELNTETLKAGNGSTKFLFFKCKSNTKYTVSRKRVLGSRFFCCYINEEPKPSIKYFSRINISDLFGSIETGNDAQYLGIYYYNNTLDMVSEVDILKEIMIEEGEWSGEFVENTILDIKYENLDDETKGVLNGTVGLNRFNTRNKIYGVKFDLSSSSTKGERIADAIGLQNDYVVNNIFQNGGKNDFDNIFPWCDIRLCNLKIENGIKKITYQNEDDFSLDGSNGNVMVEIPKFYTMREVIGDEEIWAITGEPKSGFELEPAFKDEGKENDFIYIGAYFSQNDVLNNNVYSHTNSNPMNFTTILQDKEKFNAVGLEGMDFATLLLLEILFVIEFADRDNKPYMQGISYLPYFYTGVQSFLIQEVLENNKVVVNKKNRLEYLYVGEQIGLGHQENNKDVVRTITNIIDNEETLIVTYSGETLELKALTDSLYCVGQFSGKCDNLNYHTGRLLSENQVSPFRYRYIENIWGNLWTKLLGLKVKELNYYYSFNSSDYLKTVDDPTANWKKLNYKAPNQPYLGMQKPWIVKEGYDINNRRIMLPTLCGDDNGGGNGKYYSAGFFSYYDKNYNDESIDTTQEYYSAFGGSWDGSALCSPFTLRCYIVPGGEDTRWHYGNRIVCRN